MRALLQCVLMGQPNVSIYFIPVTQKKAETGTLAEVREGSWSYSWCYFN